MSTVSPFASPTKHPSGFQSDVPSAVPSDVPSGVLSDFPSLVPSVFPSVASNGNASGKFGSIQGTASAAPKYSAALAVVLLLVTLIH